MVIYEHVKGTISVPCYNDSGDYAGYTNDIHFTENDIIKDSCSITSRACDDTTFSLGGVRPAELSIKLKLEGDGINAYNLYGAKIILYSCYAERPTESDWVLRGVFWVTSVSRVRTMYTIRASDALVWLDAGSYLKGDGENRFSNQKNPIDNMLLESYKTIGGCFGSILGLMNSTLTYMGIDTISQYEFPEAFTNIGIFANNNPPYPYGTGWTIYADDENGYFNSHTPSEYAKYLSELYCGFCAVRSCLSAEQKSDGKQIVLVPFGYQNTEEGYGEIIVNYDEIAADSCDIAGYTLQFQNFYTETWDGTKWSNYWTPSPYVGNLTIDLSGNAFLDGRWKYVLDKSKEDNINYCDDPNCNTFFPLNHIAAHLRSITVRPFKLKCYKSFSDWKTYPKLGMQILIRDKCGTEKRSILTKIIWKFRGGWEFGCAGSDSRVLSQSAKKSLASHAENNAKTYASVVAANAKGAAQAAWNYADSVQGYANGVQGNLNDTNQIATNNMGAIQAAFAALGVDFMYQYI